MRLIAEPLLTDCQEMFSDCDRWAESDWGGGGFRERLRKVRREVVRMRFEGER